LFSFEGLGSNTLWENSLEKKKEKVSPPFVTLLVTIIITLMAFFQGNRMIINLDAPLDELKWAIAESKRFQALGYQISVMGSVETIREAEQASFARGNGPLQNRVTVMTHHRAWNEPSLTPNQWASFVAQSYQN
jgi:hypothetical protein